MLIRLLMSVALSSVAAIVILASAASPATQIPRSLVAVLAHADDEGPIAPLLARYAGAGVQVYMVVVSDGSAGAGQQGHVLRPDLLTSEELATVRAARGALCCAGAGPASTDPPRLSGWQAR
jgi:LmbE family N-acetylglucosaminyl deacetylase